MTKITPKTLYFLSFLEGATVMACEISGAKLAAPFFGSSLYVWGIALGVTLVGLSSGYFAGGWLSKKVNIVRPLLWILVIASILLVFMPELSKSLISDNFITRPQTSENVSESNIGNNFIYHAVLTITGYMFLPLFLFGMAPTMIGQYHNKVLERSGKIVGNVFTISTIGGIISTFLLGFFLLPEYGIPNTLLAYGTIMGGAAILFLILNNDFLSFIPLFILSMGYFNSAEIENGKNYKMLHHSDGVLGELKVVEQPYTNSFETKLARVLLVNNTGQTIMNANKLKQPLWQDAHYFSAPAEIFPEGSKVLLLGLGGGTFYNQFKHIGHKVDIVEFDKRIAEVAKKYFN
ncbi:MAG: fused MFS/spermidine synthase, partial [Flavobacteriales bacterium]